MTTALVLELKTLFHKPGVDPMDWEKVHPNLLLIAQYVLDHCHSHGLILVITSIIRHKIKGVSTTDIHSTGRAFDVSVKGFTEEDIKYLVERVNQDLSYVGAISKRTGVSRAAVYENGIPLSQGGTGGTGPHLHFQCRR